MLKKAREAVLTALAVAVAVSSAYGQETPEEKDRIQHERELAKKRIEVPQGSPSSYLGVALGFGLAFAAFGGAFGQGRAISAAVEAVARQPEAGGRIQTMMIIGLALIETLVIYMLLICFMWGGKVA